MTQYPLGHHDAELLRLQNQAVLLHDPFLNVLAAKSLSCLEIGCGNGVNYSILSEVNPDISYIGIDISAEAIQAANARFSHHKNAKFIVGDASEMNFGSHKFDLIFTKLVLWSVGKRLQKILQMSLGMLAGGGVFYSLEPCNQLIQYYPAKPALKIIIL